MRLLSSLTSLFHADNDYGTDCTTLRGERVRSEGEKIIADYFYQNGIRYEYEQIAKTDAWIFSTKISRPDFYLPDHNVYVEYWGMIDVDNEKVRSEYIRQMRWKMEQYQKNSIKFISIYPSNLQNLDYFFMAKIKETTGIIISPEDYDAYSGTD